MSQTAPITEGEGISPNKKTGLRPILIGLVGAFLLGGGGFYAVYTKLISWRERSTDCSIRHAAEAPGTLLYGD